MGGIAGTEIHIPVSHIIAFAHVTGIASAILVITTAHDGCSAQEVELLGLHHAVCITLVHYAQMSIEGCRHSCEGTYAIIFEVTSV